jgi:tRNA-Thr(GGU) m(6)t(6)A37 methyltransferase TsaA
MPKHIPEHITKHTPSITLAPIAYIESPYKEKFAIPRQPNLVNAAYGKIIFIGDANNEELIRGIEQFSHLWLLFIFHGTQEQGWKPLVRPPRLGGNKKLGVLATRSTFRPNPIGMSVVKLEQVTRLPGGKLELNISGLDLLDGTPIIDIKPYVPYSDSLPDAQAGFAQSEPTAPLAVTFTQQAQSDLSRLRALTDKSPHNQQYRHLALLIEQVLAQDPRPAYKQFKEDDKLYGMSLYNVNIEWRMASMITVEVLSITAN